MLLANKSAIVTGSTSGIGLGIARAFAARAEAEFGRVDIVVNNAGIQHVAPVEDFPQERWDTVLAINLTAAFVLIQAVVPGMKARRFGRILNVASAHGLTASPFKSAYVAAKHGLVGLTRCVAVHPDGRRLDPALIPFGRGSPKMSV